MIIFIIDFLKVLVICLTIGFFATCFIEIAVRSIIRKIRLTKLKKKKNDTTRRESR